MIGIVDYGAGNIGSVENAFAYLSLPFTASGKKRVLRECSALVFPGVCSFGFAMGKIDSLRLRDFLVEWVNSGKKFLGICVGMQILLEGSEESPGVNGLGVVKGRCLRFPDARAKVPQVGWNGVEFKNGGMRSGYAYFVNSFYCKPEDDSKVGAITNYGLDFASALEFENCFATQFHLEKSGEYGLGLLKEWARKNQMVRV